MPKYRAFVHGVNFHMHLSDAKEVERLGFYTNVFVEAESVAAAELVAVDVLRDDPDLRQGVLNPRDDPPRLFVEEIKEIADWPADTARPRTGLALYDESQPEVADEPPNI
jgi:hypothetical protein